MTAVMATPEIIRTARKPHTCERTAHMRVLIANGVDWRTNPMFGRPCVRNDELIAIGEKYVETEGDDVYHPARYHMECWEKKA